VSYQVFARKYRPQDFDSVIGQEHVTRTLKNAIEQNRIAHAYLFVGPRGVGKTSTARILAKSLNCVKGPTVNPCNKCDACREIAQGNSLDVLEIDGASNNGVEQVRELRENVRFAPARGKFKIYIIDEVHMLTAAAFNALLKTLEEPPPHVKFIFATTEPQKVLPTILSRCQRFDLRRIPATLIADHLLHIARQEKVSLSDGAANAIARGAEGGLRDAESMLDQLVAFCGDPISEEDVYKIFGFTPEEIVTSLCDHIIEGASAQALSLIHEQAEAGKDLNKLLADLIAHFRNLLIAKADPHGLVEEFGEPGAERLQKQGDKIDLERLLTLIDQFAATEGRMKWATNRKLHFEVAIIKAIQTLQQTTLSEVIDALATIRDGTAPVKSEIQARDPSAAAPRKRDSKDKQQIVGQTNAAEEPGVGTSRASAPPAHESERPAKKIEAAQATHGAEFWQRVITEVRKQRPFLSSWIESGTLLDLSEDVCRIGFPPDQSLSMESICRAGSRNFLEELFSDLAGRPIRLECEIREGLVVAAAPVSQPQASGGEDFKDDPLIQKALEMFRAEIQSA
jgi:DNA polymerase III subunit gamma/tau